MVIYLHLWALLKSNCYPFTCTDQPCNVICTPSSFHFTNKFVTRKLLQSSVTSYQHPVTVVCHLPPEPYLHFTRKFKTKLGRYSVHPFPFKILAIFECSHAQESSGFSSDQVFPMSAPNFSSILLTSSHPAFGPGVGTNNLHIATRIGPPRASEASTRENYMGVVCFCCCLLCLLRLLEAR